MKITFQTDSARAIAKLRAIEAAGAAQPAFTTIGRVLVNRIRLCFRMGVDPWGSPWAKLKMRAGQPLRNTGRLLRSIVARPDATGVTVGTNVSYAATHQFGATITPQKARRLVFPGPGGQLIFAKRVTIPARPFMPLRRDSAVVALPPDWSADVVRALRAYFKKTVQKAAS